MPAGGGDITVTAKFMADISSFESSMQRLVSAAKSAKTEASDLGESFAAMNAASQQAGQGLTSAGNAGTNAAEGIKKTGDAAKEGGTSFMSMLSSTSNLIGNIQQIASLAGQVVSGIAQISDAAKNTALSLDNMTKNAGTTQAILDRLAETAAGKDFGTKPLAAATVQLMQMGKSAADAIPEVNALAEGLAKNGQNVDNLGSVVDKMEAIGKETHVTTADIEALDHAGLNASQALADGMGTTVPNAMKKVAEGAVSGKQAYDDMFTGLNQEISQTGQAQDQFGAKWSQLVNDMATALSPLIDGLTKLIGLLDDAVQKYGIFGLSGVGVIATAVGGIEGANTSSSNPANSYVTNPGSMAGYASGGTDLPPGKSVVGEEGWEVIDVPGGSDIYDHESSVAMMSGGGVPSVSSSSLSALPALSPIGSSSGNGGSVTVQIMLDSRKLAEQIFPHAPSLIRMYTGGH
jgi:hypothetical protein